MLPKAEEVAQAIRDRIRSGQFRPGQRLSESELVRQFGVSRTPIRHAIATLGSEGFLTVLPNRGAVVSSLSTRDLEEIYTVVAGLEGLAAHLALELVTSSDLDEMDRVNQLLRTREYVDSPNRYLDADIRFHRTYLLRCPNERLKRLIQHQLAVIHRYRILSHSIRERLVTSVDEHSHIVAAFRSRDPSAVRRHVEEHIRHGGRLLKEYLEKYGLL